MPCHHIHVYMDYICYCHAWYSELLRLSATEAVCNYFIYVRVQTGKQWHLIEGEQQHCQRSCNSTASASPYASLICWLLIQNVNSNKHFRYLLICSMFCILLVLRWVKPAFFVSSQINVFVKTMRGRATYSCNFYTFYCTVIIGFLLIFQIYIVKEVTFSSAGLII